MTDSRIEAQRAVRTVSAEPEVPDVWFSSPPDEEALKETPRSAGVQIVFTSPAPETR